MSTRLTSALPRSDGPARLRADLARATRGVRTLPGCGSRAGRLGAALPRSLFGGELSDVLAGRLRAAAVSPGAPGEASAAPRPGREGGGGAAAARARSGELSLELGGALERRAGSALHDAVGPDRVWDGPGPRGDERRDSFPDGDAAKSGDATRPRGLPDPQWRVRELKPPPGGGVPAVRGPGASGVPGGTRPAAGPTPGAAPAGRLAESVSRYWAAAARARDGGTRPAPDFPLAMEPARAAASRDADPSPQAQTDIERALHAFADGRPYVPVQAPSSWGAPGPVVNGAGAAVADTLLRRGAVADPVHGPQPGADLPARRPGRSGPAEQRSRNAALRDLADDVGEILREQALRHGIDVR